jgi:hypothetical protein
MVVSKAEADLIIANANARRSKTNSFIKECDENIKALGFLGLAIIVIPILMIGSCVSTCFGGGGGTSYGYSGSSSYDYSSVSTPAAVSVPVKPAPPPVKQGVNIEQKVTAHLRTMSVWDINKDGLTNCIDYAVRFYHTYPGESLIIRNINHSTGMNHLLNAVVLPDGDWMYVEPQGSKDNWRPVTFWGSYYDKTYNYDETSVWRIYK